MERLLNKVQLLAAEELERANNVHPQFHSRHEALGVLAEEVWEVEKEIEDARISYDLIREDVFVDVETRVLERHIGRLEKNLTFAIGEAIQCIAMLKKFRCYLDTNEEDV